MSNIDFTELKNFESKIDCVMKILNNMKSSDKTIQNLGISQADDFIKGNQNLDDINDDSFIVKVRENRTIINKSNDVENNKNNSELNKFTFMQQIEADANKRSEIRKERENIAQNFRKLGNEAYKSGEYEKAINLYTKAIDHIKDSPILYNNRALNYIKIKLYKRAIIDCDFVINKLDDKNLRAWLYRATAYHCMNDEYNFKMSIKMAKKTNSKQIDYIDKFISNMKNLM